MRQVFYEFSGPYTDFLGDFNAGLYNQRAHLTFQLLRDIEPYLYQVNGTAYYPPTQAAVEYLYQIGEISLVSNSLFHIIGLGAHEYIYIYIKAEIGANHTVQLPCAESSRSVNFTCLESESSRTL